MQVVNDELTARLQKETGLKTTDTVELLAELIDVAIKVNKSDTAIELYIDLMTQGDK